MGFIAARGGGGVRPHYAVHMTGHGWRKLMRLPVPFVYRITEVCEPLPIFSFIMRQGPVSLREAYATFNMGAGFAVYVDPSQADACLRVAAVSGYDAWRAGTVVKQGDRKAVQLEPLGITFEAETLLQLH